MKLAVGLGNPGREYQRTPHNVGFEVVDQLAERLECPVRRSFRFPARIGKASVGSEPVWLVQPQTYMNRSGAAVAPILRVKGVKIGDLIVVLDDADLPVGRLRVRPKGGSGGHKGLASIIEALQTEDFTRVRIGVGRDREGRGLVDHVLTPFTPTKQEQVSGVVASAADAVICVIESGVEAAMNRFNA